MRRDIKARTPTQGFNLSPLMVVKRCMCVGVRLCMCVCNAYAHKNMSVFLCMTMYLGSIAKWLNHEKPIKRSRINAQLSQIGVVSF